MKTYTSPKAGLNTVLYAVAPEAEFKARMQGLWFAGRVSAALALVPVSWN